MRVLDMFSGIGGFSLGLERAGMETVAFCEIDPYCRKVLKKHWPDVPIHEDIKELDGEQFRGAVDFICGGFPCQPFSQAGERRGADDDRALWPEMLRVIREVQPTWVIGENVIGLETMGLEQCVSDLESNGFAVQVFDIPACGIGAPHRRHRLWIVAHARGERRQQNAGSPYGHEAAHAGRAEEHDNQSQRHGKGRIDPNPNQPGPQGRHGRELQERPGEQSHDRECGGDPNGRDFTEIGWPTEPPVCGADDGVRSRVDRLRSLGNAVVPQIPEMIGRAILAT